MSLDRKVIKLAARQQITGNVGLFFGLSIVISIILSISCSVAVGPLVLGGPFALGEALFIRQVVRDGEGEFGTGFKGFNQFTSSLVAYILKCIFITLWSLLFIIPGVIAAIRYSMTFFILADNPTMDGYAAICKSKEMMQGHKWEFFVLCLSFFWWYLLCAITFGLAAIYVAPYMKATFFNFYENLKEASANA
ncbi:DUF975 family protein [Treponema sp.]|uniref:DUF975 family protein n=1 Tax=Treponema sp. TaxID=166 RepID=UPI00298E5F66|nr:DUF975 family protein [Treponema sp.]